MARSCAKKNCGAESEIGFPVRTSRAFMPLLSLPEQTRMKAMRSRWLGSMFAWILNTKPETSPSPGLTSTGAPAFSASRSSGGGAWAVSVARSSSTPKWRSAEPNTMGVMCPSRKDRGSKGLDASCTRSAPSCASSSASGSSTREMLLDWSATGARSSGSSDPLT